VVTKILQDYIPYKTIPFLNDIEVKGLKSRYNNKEVSDLPGVRRFVLKHIQNLNVVLADLKRARVIISAKKSMFCIAELKIVKYIYNTNGRHPDAKKVLKILS
jgi:hypothetical protein